MIAEQAGKCSWQWFFLFQISVSLLKATSHAITFFGCCGCRLDFLRFPC
jgi:hypothetical protein